ncbi:MAG TPA: hypothetical protein VFC15_00735 [Candidatus Limnocylindrales bacterium]|nr:hypothetical protein [Candidatus Limnocylindrales bacterium]
MRTDLLQSVQQLFGTRCFAYHPKPVLDLQHLLYPGAKHVLMVSNDDLNHSDASSLAELLA